MNKCTTWPNVQSMGVTRGLMNGRGKRVQQGGAGKASVEQYKTTGTSKSSSSLQKVFHGKLKCIRVAVWENPLRCSCGGDLSELLLLLFIIY